MEIQLLKMTINEVSRALNDSTALQFRDMDVTPGALPPDVILVSALDRQRVGERWFWCAVRLFVLTHENRIIGSGGFKHSPRAGAVEIGYGVAESMRGRGYASQAAELLVLEGFSEPSVNMITAETAVWNIPSQRVLEKAHFVRCGSRFDPEDGDLIKWRRERAADPATAEQSLL